jgi:hypothetical protein
VTPFGEEEEENGEMRASVWVAQRPVKLVLNLQAKMEPSSLISNAAVWQIVVLFVNGKALDLWKEIWPTNLVDTTLEGSVVWLDKMG